MEGGQGFKLLYSRFSLDPLATRPLEPFAGLYTDATDIMAEMEIFGKGSQLFVTPEVVEILLMLLNRSCWTNRKASPTRTAVSRRRGVGDKGKVGENRDQANPRSKFFTNEEIVATHPS
jgi:hypothetical protein